MSSDAGADVVTSVFDVELPPAPYPGLRPFEKNEWPIFFGRERMCDEIIAQLLQKQLIVVHGDSGSGKSSVIRAGVLPRLEQESARTGVRWRTGIAVPGEAPLWNMAEALAKIDGGADEERVVELRRALNGGNAAAATLAKLIGCNASNSVCILIDQFEELFAHARRHGADEATLLTQLLVTLLQAQTPGLYVVLTMRSEFLGVCARFAGFAELVNETQYLLPRMSASDLCRAIVEAARLYDGSVGMDLANRMIAEAGGSQDQLPLIQHGLMLMHHERANASPWRLGLENCRDGLTQSLSRHADSVMAACVREHGVPPAVVEQIFRALTEINADGQAIRRPQTLRALLETSAAAETHVRAVIDAFRAEGVSFLRPYGVQALSEHDLVDVSHEALIRCWGKLAEKKDGWLVREFRDGLLWRALLVQTESFERDAADVIGRSVINERSAWFARHNEAWAKRYGGQWERVAKLISASEQARAAMERRERITKRTTLWLTIVAVGAVIFALTIFAKFAQERAQTAELDLRLAYEQKTHIDFDARERDRADALRYAAQQLNDATDKTQDTVLKESAKKVADTLVSSASSIADTSAASTRPRVFMQYAQESQRGAVLVVQHALRTTQIARDEFMDVPAIQKVAVTPQRTELRCFRDTECSGIGATILATLNKTLASPAVTLVNLSTRYKDSPNIRANTFELWFATADEIRMRGTGPSKD